MHIFLAYEVAGIEVRLRTWAAGPTYRQAGGQAVRGDGTSRASLPSI